MKEVTKEKEIEVTFTRTVKFDDERVNDLLCCAMEGGSNYWYIIKEYGNPDKEKVEFRHLDLPFLENGYLMIGTVDDSNDDEPIRLDRAAMQKGLQIMADKYPWHFDNFINENDDAETGDVFLQCSLLGDIVYG